VGDSSDRNEVSGLLVNEVAKNYGC
jgi:hypothetical protein